ncbi:MAG: hypothetical protein ABI461_24065 [Polyangiaceae bacterium]
MKRTTSLLFGALPFALYFFHSTDAHALGPVDVELGGKVGYATNPNSDAGYNPLGLGVGARGGVEFLHGVYAGLSAMYYFGGSVDLPPPGGSLSSHAFLLGVEGGYGFHFSVLTIRPQLGLGNASFNTSSGNFSNSDSHIYLEPGVTGIVTLGLLYLGADANLLVIPGVDQGGGDSKTFASLAINGEVGVRF